MSVRKLFTKKIITAGIALSTVVIIAACAVYLQKTAPTGDGSRSLDFEVKPGWGASVVTSVLAENNLIKSRTFFRLALQMSGNTSEIKKGIYRLNDGMNAGEIIDVITSGVSKALHFTIPEGYHNRQIGDLLTEKGFFKSREDFLRAASDETILKKFKIPAESSEGYLFPDTYSIPVNYPQKKIIEHMISSFFKKTSELEGFPENPKKRHRLVILASIVEREAQRKEERSLIAGVFANRLEKNYPLESCASIQYLFEKPRKRLYYKHLEIDSPYNTYKNRGLPPGPISNPGMAAIKAALHPEDTEYMFFVVKGDGKHHFSESFTEHNRAKKKYILRE